MDDASTNRTALVAREHGARVVRVNHRQIAATRDAGAREANGAMLIFVDAATVVTGAAVRAAVEAMRAGAAGGGCAFRFDGRHPRYGGLLEALAVPLYRLLGLASGCFLCCTREAFHSAGGFNEELFGAEEAGMSRALHRKGRSSSFVITSRLPGESCARIRPVKSWACWPDWLSPGRNRSGDGRGWSFGTRSGRRTRTESGLTDDASKWDRTVVATTSPTPPLRRRRGFRRRRGRTRRGRGWRPGRISRATSRASGTRPRPRTAAGARQAPRRCRTAR